MFFPGVFEISLISQENTKLESFLNKVLDLDSCNFIKKRHFPVKFPKLLRTPWLLLLREKNNNKK